MRLTGLLALLLFFRSSSRLPLPAMLRRLKRPHGTWPRSASWISKAVHQSNIPSLQRTEVDRPSLLLALAGAWAAIGKRRVPRDDDTCYTSVLM